MFLGPYAAQVIGSNISRHAFIATVRQASTQAPRIVSSTQKTSKYETQVCMLQWEDNALHLSKLCNLRGSPITSVFHSANIGTQTAGGRTDMSAVVRGSQYKYSPAVRNNQQVITVPAPMTRLQVSGETLHYIYNS